MHTIAESFRACWDALLLRDRPYAEIRDAPNPAVRGLIIIVVVAVLVSFAALVGEGVKWGISPSLIDTRDLMLRGLREMPWYQELSDAPGFAKDFQRFYDLGWQILPRLFGADVSNAAIQLVTRPIGFFLAWLVLGLLAHILAHLLGGRGSLQQTLGCLGLAAAPQLVNALRVLPGVRTGAIVLIWTLVCGYTAIKNVHGLSWGRAFWATVLPPLIVVFIALIALGLSLSLGIIILGQGG